MAEIEIKSINGRNICDRQAREGISSLELLIGELQNDASGMGVSASKLLINILRNGVYTNSQNQNIDTLEMIFASSNEDGETSNCMIIYNLADVTSSNTSTTVKNGEDLITTLTAADGYTLQTVTVTMGGMDITNSVYSNGTISISSVTNTVIITAKAVDTYKWSIGYTTGVNGDNVNYIKPYNNTRAIYTATSGEVELSSQSGDDSGYYPILVPDGATKVTIVAEGYCCSVNQLKLVNGIWCRIADTGWMSLNGDTCTLADGTEAIVCVAKLGEAGTSNISNISTAATVKFS